MNITFDNTVQNSRKSAEIEIKKDEKIYKVKYTKRVSFLR